MIPHLHRAISIITVATVALTVGCRDHMSRNQSPHWGYSGAESPEHWAELSQEFIECAEGHHQSPIDIESWATTTHPGSVLEFLYHPTPVDEVNNGHTVEARPEETNFLIAEGDTFQLRQFHFHEPSEHHLDGIIFPMEMHMVHQDKKGRLAVIGVFIKEGPENTVLSEILDLLPPHIDEHRHPGHRCDLVHLLPEDKPVFHYTGSLTTPPCTEGVEWYILREPITLSKSQIKHFRDLYHENSRPVQAQDSVEIEILP